MPLLTPSIFQSGWCQKSGKNSPSFSLSLLLFGKQKVPKRVSDTLLSAVLFRFSGDYSCQHWFLHTTKKFPASQGFSVDFRLLLLRKSGNTYHFIIEFWQVPVKFRLRNNKTPSTQFFCSIYEGSKGELTDSRKGLFFDEFPSSSPPSQSSRELSSQLPHPPFAYILCCRKQRKSNCCLEAPLLNLAYLETGSFMALTCHTTLLK